MEKNEKDKLARERSERVINDRKITGRFITQAISQPDERQEKTGVAMPSDENVSRARNWVDENHK